MSVKFTNESLVNLMDLMTLEEGGLIFKLFKNDLTITDAVLKSDFVEADYSTYLPYTVFPNPPFSDTVTPAGVNGPIAFAFPTPGGGDTGTLYGWWAEEQNEAGTYSIIAAQRFDTPIDLPNDTITLAYALTLKVLEDFPIPLVMTRFLISATVPPGSMPTAAFDVSVSAVDQNNNPFSGYTGDVTLGLVSIRQDSGGSLVLTDSGLSNIPSVCSVIAGVGVASSGIKSFGGPINPNVFCICGTDDSFSGASDSISLAWS